MDAASSTTQQADRKSWQHDKEVGETDRSKAEAISKSVETKRPLYQYTALSDPTKQFRLATIEPSPNQSSPIQCSLSVHDLSESIEYFAISYVCGDPADSNDIYIDNANLAIYATLDNAIRHMRKADTPLVIWADAICIHQGDDHEKSTQVGMMAKIYGNAKSVSGWLGPANESVSLALRTLERLGTASVYCVLRKTFNDNENYRFIRRLMPRVKQYFKIRSLAAGIAKDLNNDDKTSSASPFLRRVEKAISRNAQGVRPGSLSLDTMLGNSVSSAIETFLQNSFFRRTWIYQELALAERVTFHCGHRSYDGISVLHGIHSYCQYSNDSTTDSRYGWYGLWGRARTVLRVRYSLHDSNHAPAETLLQLIVFFSEASCADTRDKVFALLAMTSGPVVEKNPADYSLSAIEVATRLTSTYVDETHSLDILRFCGRGNAPSWALNLDALAVRGIAKGSHPYFEYHTASALHAKVVVDGTDSDLDRIQLAGIHLQAIQEIACLCTSSPRNRNSNPLNEWWELAKSVGYDELDFWMALLAESLQAHDDTSELQRRREKVQVWLKRKDSRWPQEQFFRNIRYNTGYRMFVTDSGWLGFCEEFAQEGDLVCVLFGGDTPYILRPTAISSTRSRYTLIEPCYVHGIMEGELVERIEAGEFEEKVFALV